MSQDQILVPGAGHNSRNIAGDELKLLVERVERIEAEMKDLRDDRKDVYGEAKARGYDVRTMRKLVAARKLDSAAFKEMRALEEVYLDALDMLS